MPAPPTTDVQPGRRAVLRAGLAGLGGAGVLGLSGCRLRVGAPTKAGPTVAPVRTADQLALDRAATRADQLAALYAQAALVRADIAPALRQLAADHAAHVQALQALGAEPATATTTTPTTTTTTTSTTSPTTAPSPGATTIPTAPALTATTALSALGRAERSAAQATLADLAPIGPQPARLLASIAGCQSAHVAVLARLPARPRSAGTTTTAAP